jgi:polar amino acid transport system substrate-binding protein
MGRRVIGFLTVVFVALCLVPATAWAEPELKTWDDLTGRTVGLVTGTPFEENVKERNKDAKVAWFTGVPDMIMALKSNKIDACAASSPLAELSTRRTEGIAVFPEVFFTNDFGMVFPKNSPVYEEWNAAVHEMAADGSLEGLFQKWTLGTGEETVPEQTWPGSKGTLKCLALTTQEPLCYLARGKTLGFEPEVALRVAERLDYHIKFIPVEFPEFMASIESNKGDFGLGNVMVTEERKKAVDFAIEGDLSLTLLVRDDGTTAAGVAGLVPERIPEYTTLEELEGKRVGVATGGYIDHLVKEIDPNIKNFSYFNSYSDMAASIESRKIAAAIVDEPVGRLLTARNPTLAMMEGQLSNNVLAFALKKGSPYTKQLSAAIDEMAADGTLDDLAAEWFDGKEADKQIPEVDWDTSAGTLKVATDGANEPFSYMRSGKLVGYDIEVMTLCAKALHMDLKLTSLPFDSLLTSVESGKADVAAAGITITDERAQAVDFTSPIYSSGFVAVVRNVGEADSDDMPFLTSLAASFNKTFIVEDRWQMILSGLVVTCIIFVVSAALGTVLGFFTTVIRNGGNRVGCSIIDAFEGLMGRLPIVVVLMVFYYVIFGAIDISGIVVATIVFTLSFGANAGSIMWNAVRAVDAGQREGSLALGFTERETFYQVVLPTAARRFLPLLSGQMVSLVKETSVVGYISVIDLTRATDLIRSRTMEAFFPLIVSAAIYFALCCAVAAILNVIIKRTDLNHRPREIKGVSA